MTFSILTPAERRRGLAFAIFLGLFLAGGFLPTARQFFLYLEPYLAGLSLESRRAIEIGFFPVLAALFHFSLPRPKLPRQIGLASLVRLSLIPLGVAVVYGALHPAPALFERWGTPEGKLGALWYLVAVPIGEELLFRGWLYGVTERLYPGKFATATNPLPTAVWTSALAFSLWHVQNFGIEPWTRVLFQCFYTLLTGLWLGYLRWKTGTVTSPLLAHSSLNLASNLL